MAKSQQGKDCISVEEEVFYVAKWVPEGVFKIKGKARAFASGDMVVSWNLSFLYVGKDVFRDFDEAKARMDDLLERKLKSAHKAAATAEKRLERNRGLKEQDVPFHQSS